MQLAKNQHPSQRWVLIFAARVPQRTRGSTVRQFRAQDRRRYEIPTVLAEGQNNCRDGTEAAKPPEYSRTPLHEKTPSIRMAFFLCRSRSGVHRGRCPHRPGSMHHFYGSPRRIRWYPWGDVGIAPYAKTGRFQKPRRGGRPCPPGKLHDRNAKVFGEFVDSPGRTESSAPTPN